MQLLIPYSLTKQVDINTWKLDSSILWWWRYFSKCLPLQQSQWYFYIFKKNGCWRIVSVKCIRRCAWACVCACVCASALCFQGVCGHFCSLFFLKESDVRKCREVWGGHWGVDHKTHSPKVFLLLLKIWYVTQHSHQWSPSHWAI